MFERELETSVVCICTSLHGVCIVLAGRFYVPTHEAAAG